MCQAVACHMQQQLAPAGRIRWAPFATDPSKLRSLLLNPLKYPEVCLFEQKNNGVASSYAVSHELLPHNQGIRCTIYGNTTCAQPDFKHAAQKISSEPTSVCRFSALPDIAVGHVREVFSSSGYQETYYNPCWQYVVTDAAIQQLQHTCERLAKELSGTFQISTLQHEDAALVNELWTFRSPGSLPMIQQLIQECSTACVRTAAGDPVAWVVEVEPGCAGMLHTLESYRRTGLGKWVLASLLRKLHHQHKQQDQQLRSCSDHTHSIGNLDIAGSDGNCGWPGGHVYCYVVQENNASVQLLESLGLTRTGTFVWMGFEKQATIK